MPLCQAILSYSLWANCKATAALSMAAWAATSSSGLAPASSLANSAWAEARLALAVETPAWAAARAS